jgi:hypothetical protein
MLEPCPKNNPQVAAKIRAENTHNSREHNDIDLILVQQT